MQEGKVKVERHRIANLYAIIALVAVSLFAPETVRSQSAQLQHQCLTMGEPGQVEACSALIAAGRGDVAEYHYARGSVLLDRRDCDGALAEFDAAVRLKPRAADYHGARGLVFYQCKSDFGQAVVAFSNVVRLQPRNDRAYDILATSKRFSGDVDGALADDDTAIRLAPNTATYYGNRGILHEEKGDHAGALADYNRAVELAPDLDAAYGNRGFFFIRIGELDLAIADLTTAIRLKPNYAKAYANRAEAWRLKGDLQQSLADLDQAIRFDPKDPLGFARRADTLRYQGDFREAIAADDQALAIMPDYIPAFTGRGLSFERLGDIAQAKVEYGKAVASKNYLANLDYSKETRETARVRLAALDAGAVSPTILPAPRRAGNLTSIPTQIVKAPVVPDDLVRATVASQGRRIALVIGNAGYQSVVKLINPANDAALMAASLRNVGFDSVSTLADSPHQDLLDGLRAFAEQAKSADWAVIYYAGHGVEVDGVDYMIPVDAKIKSSADLTAQAVPVSQIVSSLAGARKLKLVVLDACRDNPFPAPDTLPSVVASAALPSLSSDGTRSLARNLTTPRGLAAVTVDNGTLVVFSAKEGQAALDGEGSDSPFAIALVQRIGTPGVEINTLFHLVRDDVMEATAGRQEPYTYGSLPDRQDLFFVVAK